jgi:hypothetical protein
MGVVGQDQVRLFSEIDDDLYASVGAKALTEYFV